MATLGAALLKLGPLLRNSWARALGEAPLGCVGGFVLAHGGLKFLTSAKHGIASKVFGEGALARTIRT